MISHFFIDRPIFAAVLSIVVTLAGAVAVFTLPVAQYPDVTPPTVLVTRHLSRRQRPDRARHRGRADRAAGQRRREHDLHVVAMHQRRRLQADGHVQAGHGFRHGPGAGAEPRVAGHAGHSRPGAARRDQRQEDVAQHDDDRQPGLARRPLRRHLSEQLRHDPDQGRTGPIARRRQRRLSGPARLQHAGLARSRQAGLRST